MATSLEELDIVRDLRVRAETHGSVFWTEDGDLAVLDAETAQRVNALDFADLTLPDKLGDGLRGRTSDPVSWKQVRAAWSVQMRRLSEAHSVEQLARRMDDLFEERLDRPLDLVWVAQEVCTQALVPIVVAGLSPGAMKRVLCDQTLKLERLLVTKPVRDSFWKECRSIFAQVGAGMVVRFELRGRAKGRRPRQVDLADPIVDLLPTLGMDRAVDAVTAVLTAIAGERQRGDDGRAIGGGAKALHGLAGRAGELVDQGLWIGHRGRSCEAAQKP